MRVAFIHPFLYRYPRGIERYTISLANALARTGVEVHILTWRWPQPVQIDTLDPQVQVHLMPTSRYYAARAVVPFYAWDLLKHAYDFVWIFFAGYGEAQALGLARRMPFGIVFHYPFAEVPHRYDEFRRHRLVQRAARLVSVSQFVADGVCQQLGRESVVIHHGVDARRFAPDASAYAAVRRSLKLAPDAPLLVSAAALEERKGLQRVLRALPHIRREWPDVTYLVLGEGAYRTSLEQLARDLQVADCVHFLGAQADVAPFYQAADLSLVLAHGEASSLAALESLACGVPVIAADWRPFDELIGGDDGIRVGADDERQVAQAVGALLRDPQRRRAMGERGRTRILAEFQWERVAEQYVELLDPHSLAQVGNRELERRSGIPTTETCQVAGECRAVSQTPRHPPPDRFGDADRRIRRILDQRSTVRQYTPSVVVPVLTYHQVEPARDRPPDRPGLVVDTASFRRQMLLVRALGYRAISMGDLAAGLAGDRVLPRRAMVLTFDDGYAGVYQFAFPILRRHGFRGTLFLIAEDFDADTPRSVQRAFPVVTRRQVAEMVEAGFEPGSHTLTHPRLPDLPSERARAEIDRSKAILEGAFGQRLAAFCYPYGAYNRALELAVTEAGYRCAVTTHFGRRHHPDERFALKRISVGYAQSLAQFAYRLLLAREA